MDDGNDVDALRARIKSLESQIALERGKRRQSEGEGGHTNLANGEPSHDVTVANGLDLGHRSRVAFQPSLHNLLLLSDSALPLGSFAYSNGLESFLAHHKPLVAGNTPLSLFQKFLRLSIESVAFTAIPYVLAGFRHPSSLLELDNDLDASTLCKVARAASIAQGRALLSVWERSFAPVSAAFLAKDSETHASITDFASALKLSTLSSQPLGVNGHLAPLWGVVSRVLGQNQAEVGYTFLLNHAKAILSAAVRANVLGPYMSQSVLAGHDLQSLIRSSLDKVWHLPPEEAAQAVPPMDLWMGRHEMLYSRIFNS